MRFFYLFLVTGLAPLACSGQIIWLEDFESEGNGTRYETDLPEFYGGGDDFWGRFVEADVSVHPLATIGTYLWAAHDLDDNDSAGGNGEATITWSDIAIPSAGQVTIGGLFAGSGMAAYDAEDGIELRYQLPGQDWLVAWAAGTPPGTAFSQHIYVDDNGDGTFSNGETQLASELAFFSVGIPTGGATSISVQVYVHSDSTDETFFMDQLSINLGAPLAGCLDAAACNYNSTASFDDGTCCLDNCLNMAMFDQFGDGWNGATYVISDTSTGIEVATGGLTNGSGGADALCLPDGCYRMQVIAGAFPTEVSWSLSLDVSVILSGGAPFDEEFVIGDSGCNDCNDPTACNYDASDTGTSGCIYPNQPWENCDGTCINDVDGDGVCDEVDDTGCTYAQACNFNPSAIQDDGTCSFPGCMDPLAVNHNPTAGCDDGGCLFVGCIYPSALNFNPAADLDNGSCTFSFNILCPTDLNNDQSTDVSDILILIPAFGVDCSE